LPYIAELMDLRPEQSRWRVAVEKVLRVGGLRLLSPTASYARSAAGSSTRPTWAGACQPCITYARIVGVEPTSAEPKDLAGKLFPRRPTHVCAAEAAAVIAAAGDHVCVDDPDVFSPLSPPVHRHRAVQGLRSAAIKDDRRPRGSPTTSSKATSPPRSTPLTVDLANA